MENGGAKTVDSGEARLRALGENSPCCMPHLCASCLQRYAQLWHPNDAMWVERMPQFRKLASCTLLLMLPACHDLKHHSSRKIMHELDDCDMVQHFMSYQEQHYMMAVPQAVMLMLALLGRIQAGV